MPDTTPQLTHNGVDDWIPPEGLEKILELVEKLPDEFDVTSMQAYPSSVVVTFRFPNAASPQGQHETAENLIQAALCTGTLARNLRHERAHGVG